MDLALRIASKPVCMEGADCMSLMYHAQSFTGVFKCFCYQKFSIVYFQVMCVCLAAWSARVKYTAEGAVSNVRQTTCL